MRRVQKMFCGTAGSWVRIRHTIAGKSARFVRKIFLFGCNQPGKSAFLTVMVHLCALGIK